MNPEKQAAALRKIAEGIYEYADLLFDSPEPVSSGGPVAAVTPSAAAGSMPEFPPLDPFIEDEEIPLADEGSEAVCPKHRVPYRDGKFGPFCASQTDDPAWGRQRDGKVWCKITPKNAAEYLRIQAAA